MTRFEFETAELARFDRRLLTDIGLGLEGQGPDASRLRKLAARSSLLARILELVTSRLAAGRVSAPAAR